MGYQEHVRSESTGWEIGDVLRASPGVLLGVDAGAAHALSLLGIETVFDLARSATFGAADVVVRAATDAETAESRSGELPGDLFTTVPTVALAEVPRQDVGILRLVAAANDGGLVAESLDVRSIRDLALWPPYVAAKEIVAEAAGAAPLMSEATPGDLLPMSGRYPTERAYYSSYVLADLDDPTGAERTPLENAGPLDPVTAVTGEGFARPVRGARLTFAQSWYSQGVALGQLLHSLALAPGESTRVAMIDWSRQQTGRQMEQAGQVEQLVGDITRKRALTEVQNAVAAESQHGFSQNTTSSRQVQGGGGGGFSLGGLTVGGSGSTATASVQSATVTGTSGVRSISAAMTQNVADATHQAASSARNMYASVVRELSQSEHEGISTRLVANFNHMHALTVQYYEVVQIYRTTVGLHRFEPCLFVPIKPVDWLAEGPDGAEGPAGLVIRRYRAALQAAALDTATRSLLDPDALGVVEIRPSVQAVLTVLRGFTKDASGKLVPVTGTEPLPTTGPPPTVPAAATATLAQQIDHLRRVLGRDVITRDGDTLELPDDMTVRGVSASFPCAAARFVLGNGTALSELTAPASPAGDPFQVAVDPPVRLTDVSALYLNPAQSDVAQVGGVVTLSLEYQGEVVALPVPVVVAAGGGGHALAMSFRRRSAVKSLLQQLADNALYYSQVVWQAMDSATVALLLAPYTYAERPLAQVVDATPIAVSGNYLVFRMPWEARDLLDGSATAPPVDGAWREWVQRHADYGAIAEDLVPLPSGGVFAEAVLGRSNSAEKLDITRFWNWQDSPIPLSAPDIAAVQAGSRAQADTTTPSGLAAPVVAFNNPPSLPDPAGLAATLGTLGNGGIFRDMSGASTAQALALAALAGAGQGATAAGEQGAAHAAVAAQKEVEMARIVAGLLGGGALGGAGTGSISAQGARINEGRSLDERAGAASAEADGAGSESHEAQAAEGQGGRALDVLDRIAATPPTTDGARPSVPAEPASSDATTSTPASPKPPAKPAKPASQAGGRKGKPPA